VVEPIFLAAGFEMTVHETKHAGHATELVRGEKLELYLAVVAVGGDGTVFEILQVGI
jgi:diacylglycerol kinase family enzyme